MLDLPAAVAAPSAPLTSRSTPLTPSPSRKSRQICYMRLTQLITAAGLPWWQFQALHASLSKAWSEGSSASRIKYSPIPQARGPGDAGAARRRRRRDTCVVG